MNVAKFELGFLAIRCPACKGPHEVPVNQVKETPREWLWNGSLEKPTLHPSLRVRSSGVSPDGKKAEHICHFHVRDGKIEFCGDSTHELKNQAIELLPY